jgi:uncharacterized protein (DUF1330 family)
MKRSFTVGLAMVAGAALGAAAVEGLHAQVKPPVYQIVEIDVLNQDAYVNDYAPKAQAAIKAAGGKFLAAGGKTTTIEGDPPKNRIVIQQWDSVEKIAAYRASAAFKDLLPLREKLAKFSSFTVEGCPNNLTGRCKEGRLQGGLLSIRLSRMAVRIMPSGGQERSANVG